MSRVVEIRISDVASNNTCVIAIVDHPAVVQAFSSLNDYWVAYRAHSIGRDDRGPWSRIVFRYGNGSGGRLQLRDSSGLVMVLDRFPERPMPSNSGGGEHLTPGRYIGVGAITWEVVAVR